jgi:hypothetical protein
VYIIHLTFSSCTCRNGKIGVCNRMGCPLPGNAQLTLFLCQKFFNASKTTKHILVVSKIRDTLY